MEQAVVTSTDVSTPATQIRCENVLPGICFESPQDKNATQMDKARWSRANGKHHRGRSGRTDAGAKLPTIVLCVNHRFVTQPR